MLKIYILAGGFGTRLLEVVKNVPKSMAPVGKKPFLDYQIDLIKNSIDEYKIYLLTHYKSEIIENYYSNNPTIDIIRETNPLGTGGAIKNAMKIVNHQIKEPALIMNGDSYIDVDYNDFIKKSKNNINILCKFQKDCERSSTLEIENSIIKKFNKQGCNKESSYISTGCYYFNNTSIIQNNSETIFMIEELFENICKEVSLAAHIYDGEFIDIGVPKDYFKFCENIKNEY